MVYPARIMKQSTRKNSSLSLVTSLPEVTQPQAEKAAELKDSFDGWLNSVAPTLIDPPTSERSEAVPRGRRSLSSTDILRVNRATIRESDVPRHWPPDVVLTFLAADVIKPNKQ